MAIHLKKGQGLDVNEKQPINKNASFYVRRDPIKYAVMSSPTREPPQISLGINITRKISRKKYHEQNTTRQISLKYH